MTTHDRLPRAGGGPEKLRRLVGVLAEIVGAPVEASPEVRERWTLGGWTQQFLSDGDPR